MEWISQIDARILLFIQEYLRMDWMNVFWKFVTFLGDGGFIWILSGVLLLFPKKTRHIGIAALASLFVCFLLTNVALKNIVARPRPFEAFPAIVPIIKKPGGFSFPSGHTTASFAAALVYFRMLPRKYGVAALGLAGLIGLSRLYVGVHYPSDVIGGFLVGLLGSALVCYLFSKITSEKVYII